jgi:periplasmic protein CpxP/Spy
MQPNRKLLALAISLILSIGAGMVRAENADAGDQVAAAEDQTQSKQRDPAKYVQTRLAKLKSALDIKPEQEAQWSAFADTVMQQVDQMKAAHQQRGNMPATAPERIDRQIAMIKQRAASFETIGEAAKGLYASLSPDQQQIADKRLLRWHGQHRG